VGVNSYVETYEHRLVAGLDAPEVHHINHVKDDNRPENLAPVSSLEHGAHHSRIDIPEATALYASGWSLQKLAAKYGVFHSTVYWVLKRRGVRLRTAAEALQFKEAQA
jgi:hypothetical protein